MAGSMRTFVTDRQTDRQTDGQTDGADYIGPEAGPKTENIERSQIMLSKTLCCPFSKKI